MYVCFWICFWILDGLIVPISNPAHDRHPNMSPPAAMRNCGGSDCFLGNESRRAVTGTHCRFGEVGKVYGEESGWHKARVVL